MSKIFWSSGTGEICGEMLGWTVGQSSRTREDQYNDGQVVDSKAIPDRFDGDFQ